MSHTQLCSNGTGYLICRVVCAPYVLCRQVEGGRRKRKGETWNAADLGYAQDLRVLARLFVFCYVWSVGGNVHDKGRAQFDADLRGRLAKLFSEQSMGLGWEKSETCYDVYVDTKTGKWADWTNIIEDFTYDPATPYFNILVPTADTTRCNYMLELLMPVS